MIRVDLNCDMGESFGNYVIGRDEEILQYITSANIACGFHGGDPVVMSRTVKMALENGIKIGAHPGFPDLIGFGRREINISKEEARAYIIYQVGALNAFVNAYGGKLSHVKPHGALYNMAAKDYNLARTLAEAVYDVDESLIFVGLANSMLIKAAKDIGMRYAQEVFADRAYNADGSLVPRTKDGAVIHDTSICINRVISMVTKGLVQSIEGYDIPLKADTICIHGDNEMAVEFAKALNSSLKKDGIELIGL